MCSRERCIGRLVSGSAVDIARIRGKLLISPAPGSLAGPAGSSGSGYVMAGVPAASRPWARRGIRTGRKGPPRSSGWTGGLGLERARAPSRQRGPGSWPTGRPPVRRCRPGPFLAGDPPRRLSESKIALRARIRGMIRYVRGHAQVEANSGRRRDGQAMAVSRRGPAGISWPALSVTSPP